MHTAALEQGQSCPNQEPMESSGSSCNWLKDMRHLPKGTYLVGAGGTNALAGLRVSDRELDGSGQRLQTESSRAIHMCASLHLRSFLGPGHVDPRA